MRLAPTLREPNKGNKRGSAGAMRSLRLPEGGPVAFTGMTHVDLPVYRTTTCWPRTPACTEVRQDGYGKYF
ncbi:MAG: hypothetical protein JWR80_6402 [Bradyrhizobium sp.]|nr:hypothetical protein [Bradyrhizobium sp.]